MSTSLLREIRSTKFWAIVRGLSLVAVAALWIASYSTSIWWPPYHRGTGLQFHAWHGTAYLIWVDDPHPPPGGWVTARMLEMTFAPGAPFEHFNPIADQLWNNPAVLRNGLFRDVIFFSRAPSLGNACGFQFGRPLNPGTPGSFFLAAPIWAIAALLGGWSFLAWRRNRIATREGQHLCLQCGYDLRATPDRCPECGAIPTNAALVTRPT